MIKTYNKMCQFLSFEDRFDYLKLSGAVGASTFGYDRYLNQILYHSPEWKNIRRQILIRDCGCDLGVPGREIFSSPIIHHINPITAEDIELRSEAIFSLNNLVLVSANTHQALHFGSRGDLILLPKVREKGDTKLW